MVWNHNDSEPFREPVDYVEHPGKTEDASMLDFIYLLTFS